VRNTLLLRRPADGSGRTDTLLSVPQDLLELEIGRDGRTAVLVEQAGSGLDVFLGRLDSLSARRPLLASRSNEQWIALSPSGNWLAYVSDETGRDEVYVRAAREGSGKAVVSRRGGVSPRWAANGRDLYFLTSDSLFVSRMADGSEPRPGPPRAVMALSFYATTLFFDVMPDGRFLWSRYNVGTLQSITLTLHWFEQLGRE
jgi:Tol biopolymer transport system component